MARKVKTRGLEKTLQEIAQYTKSVAKTTERGVILAGMLVRREAMKKAPVRTGNLWNSAYVVSSSNLDPPGGSGGKFKGKNKGKMESAHETEKGASKVMAKGILRGPVAMVGFSAVYALSVHENPSAGKAGAAAADAKAGITGADNRPAYARHSRVGGYKFLENALKENEARILAIIKKEADRG